MTQKTLHEITPLTEGDCFMIFSRKKDKFDFPLHYHEEFEVNFIRNAAGSQRIVGDHTGKIGNIELAMIGSNLPHGWFTHDCKSKEIEEITVQFHHDFLEDTFLQRDQLDSVRRMLDTSMRGILFSEQTAFLMAPRIVKLAGMQGFDSVLELISILHDLSISRDMRLLSNLPPTNKKDARLSNNDNIQKVLQYVHLNYKHPVSIKEMAAILNMSEALAGRFFKRHTGSTFKDILNEVRMGNASRLLIDTTQSINEIAYTCGFNSLSYFNRIFKMKRNVTPKEFRERFSGTRTFI